MRLETLIGAQICVGFPGTQASQRLIRHLRALQAQSIILFARNIQHPRQVSRLIRDLQRGLGWRLLVLIDHEGGRVVRFRRGLTMFPAAREAAQAGTPSAIERQGATEARELKPLGIAVNLAPCVDVAVPGSDPVIGDRSYGDAPRTVSRFAPARIRGLQRHGVAACAKHFPGLGAVRRDPHKMLPTIRLDRAAMERVHLVPFRSAIRAGVAMVMSSHVCYPRLGDPEGWPATFSRRLIHGWLRERLGFRGVIVSDDLLMGALRSFGTVGTCAVQAVAAGHDLLLICADLSAQVDAYKSLQCYYLKDIRRQKVLTASIRRIYALRARFLS